MKKLNLKRLFSVIFCLSFIIFTIFYLVNVISFNNLIENNIGVNSSYINLNSKSVKNIAIKTARVASTSLVRTKKLQSYVEIGGLELPLQGSTGYASVKMNVMSEPNSNSNIVTTFIPRKWF